MRSTSCSTPLVNHLQARMQQLEHNDQLYRLMHPPLLHSACYLDTNRSCAPWSGRQQQGCGDDGDRQTEVDLHMENIYYCPAAERWEVCA